MSPIATAIATTVSSKNAALESPTPLNDLADRVKANAAAITGFLQSNGFPQPSFERDAPAVTLPASAPIDAKKARQALMEDALRIFQLAIGPSEYLPNLAVGYQYLACLHWLIHFKIFSLVPLTGSIRYSQLATAAGVSEQRLKTVARMAMTSNLFCEPSSGEIAHTATSALLVTNPNLHDWAVFMTETSAPTAANMVDASKRWSHSTEKTETAYNLAFKTDLPFFDHLTTLPEKTKQFAGYMKNVTNSEGTAIHHLLRGFDWAGLGKATVVDVGGSTGAASIALAREFPDLHFIVQDLSENAANGQTSILDQPSDIASRIAFHGHNFFEEQPIKGVTVYLLRMILHDWPAKEATTILQNLVPALNRNSRIIIMDSVMPTPGSIPSTQERLIRHRDLTMLQSFNSLERDIDDWKDLLSRADDRLSLVNVVQPVGSVMSVLEVKLSPVV